MRLLHPIRFFSFLLLRLRCFIRCLRSVETSELFTAQNKSADQETQLRDSDLFVEIAFQVVHRSALPGPSGPNAF